MTKCIKQFHNSMPFDILYGSEWRQPFVAILRLLLISWLTAHDLIDPKLLFYWTLVRCLLAQTRWFFVWFSVWFTHKFRNTKCIMIFQFTNQSLNRNLSVRVRPYAIIIIHSAHALSGNEKWRGLKTSDDWNLRLALHKFKWKINWPKRDRPTYTVRLFTSNEIEK